MEPYKTLPDIFPNIENLDLDLEDSALTAMIAYSYLQFTDLSDETELYNETHFWSIATWYNGYDYDLGVLGEWVQKMLNGR